MLLNGSILARVVQLHKATPYFNNFMTRIYNFRFYIIVHTHLYTFKRNLLVVSFFHSFCIDITSIWCYNYYKKGYRK